MIIYIDRQPKFRIPKRTKVKNTLWPRLEGINISPGEDPEVTPVYVPFLRYYPGDGQIVLEISGWSHKFWVVMLYTRWPFIYVTRTEGIELDTKDL